MTKTTLAICLALALSACSKEEAHTETTTTAEDKAVATTAAETAAPAATAEAAPAAPTAPTPPTAPSAEATADLPNADKAALMEEAKGAAMALGGNLKKELQAAMGGAGPVAAVEVCVERAPAIAQQISAEKNLEVGRVSLKNRNPGNEGNDWQTAVLNDFEARKAAGEEAGKLAYAETVDVDGKKEFRFMKAIPTAGLCLTCHGDNIPAEVAAKLTEHYPDDKATGYKEGDLRGAFYVVKPL